MKSPLERSTRAAGGGGSAEIVDDGEYLEDALLPRPGILPPTLKVRLVKLQVAPWSELRAIAPLFGSQLWI